MAARRRGAALAAGLILLATGLFGCGSGGSDQSSSAAIPASGEESVLETGKAASRAELEQAAGALRRLLHSVAAGRWGGVCAAMAAASVEELEREAAGTALPPDCPGAVARLARLRSARALRAEARDAKAVTLRIDGDRALVVYEGADSLRAMPMAKQGGVWKPAALIGTPVG